MMHNSLLFHDLEDVNLAMMAYPLLLMANVCQRV
jgi:hypothetical protein